MKVKIIILGFFTQILIFTMIFISCSKDDSILNTGFNSAKGKDPAWITGGGGTKVDTIKKGQSKSNTSYIDTNRTNLRIRKDTTKTPRPEPDQSKEKGGDLYYNPG